MTNECWLMFFIYLINETKVKQQKHMFSSIMLMTSFLNWIVVFKYWRLFPPFWGGLLICNIYRHDTFFTLICITNTFFKKDFLYLFLERSEEGEKKRERNINVWFPLMLPPTEDLAHNPGMCPD